MHADETDILLDSRQAQRQSASSADRGEAQARVPEEGGVDEEGVDDGVMFWGLFPQKYAESSNCRYRWVTVQVGRFPQGYTDRQSIVLPTIQGCPFCLTHQKSCTEPSTTWRGIPPPSSSPHMPGRP